MSFIPSTAHLAKVSSAGDTRATIRSTIVVVDAVHGSSSFWGSFGAAPDADEGHPHIILLSHQTTYPC
jgi:hypothetical protein